MNIVSIIVLIIYVLQIMTLIAVIFVENKNPVSTVSWVLILSFLPIIGFIFYLFFGRGLSYLTHRKLKLTRQIQEDFGDLIPHSRDYYHSALDVTNDQAYKFNDKLMNDYTHLMKLSHNLCLTPYTQNNELKIYIDGKEKYHDLLEDIKNAQVYIHMTYFIISNTDISHELIDLLSQKVKEGVEVKVIYDEIGNFVVPSKMFKKITNAGGDVYKFFPLTFSNVLHANYRSHHKIVVIDGQIGYTGGMNIGDEYMGLHPRKTPWRDTHLRVTGDIVKSLQAAFLIDLFYVKNDRKEIEGFINKTYFPDPIETGSVGMQLISSGPDDNKESIKRILISMINCAKKSVYIQTPYLMPDQPLMEAIQNAAKSGIDVRLMLPGIYDKRVPYMVTYSYIENMLDYGVKVYMHKGFLHAKTLVIDDTISTIGTTNLDMRSLSLHFEINTILFDSKVSKQYGDVFRKDLEISWRMTREIYEKRKLSEKFFEKIFRLFAPLM